MVLKRSRLCKCGINDHGNIVSQIALFYLKKDQILIEPPEDIEMNPMAMYSIHIILNSSQECLRLSTLHIHLVKEAPQILNVYE